MQTVWKIFFLLISAVVLVLIGRCSFSLYEYFSLNTPVAAHVTEWNVVETAPSSFQISSKYTYTFNGKRHGSYLFPAPIYTNSFVAHEHLKNLEQQEWTAYVSSYTPTKSALQHNFPFKDLIHTVLGCAVLVYFMWLRMYVTTRYAIDRP